MISEAPSFLENEHFRINRKAGKKWRYTTLRTTRIVIDHPINERISFRDRNGIEWFRLSTTACGKTLASIPEGYSWDGATCAPDGGLYLATLVHDVLYQFRFTRDFPFSRRECDIAFLDLMRIARFPLAPVYYRAVRWFGKNRGGHNGEWSKVLTTFPI